MPLLSYFNRKIPILFDLSSIEPFAWPIFLLSLIDIEGASKLLSIKYNFIYLNKKIRLMSKWLIYGEIMNFYSILFKKVENNIFLEYVISFNYLYFVLLK